MTTETETPSAPESYPWDTPESWYHRVQASLAVTPATPVELFDYPHPDMTMRVIGLRIADFTLHIGSLGGDPEIVTVTDRLIALLQELKGAADQRIAAAPVPA